MRFVAFVAAALMAVLMVAYSAPAQAQATRTWVSGVGDDANPCSRTAPCKTFAGAISKTAAGGEINCLDPGGFGAVTITKSIALICEGSTLGGVLVSGTNGIIVNAAASDVVTLRGLDINGLGTGLSGVSVLQAAAVHVENCLIRGFNGGSTASGINFTPSGNSELTVTNSYISENGNGGAGAGIRVKPSGGNSLLSFNRVTLANNSNGIAADGSGTSGTVRGIVRESDISGNSGSGIVTSTGSGATSILVDHASVSNNGTGLSAANGSSILVTDTAVTGNNIGLSTSGGGQLDTYQNNHVNSNITSNGAFTLNVTPQ